MDFFDQPRDVIFNQELVDLPIKDLLNACQTNPLFDQLCKDPDLWRVRIKHDYPEVSLVGIKNPREFYLKQVLFGGKIYVHNHVDDINEIPYEVIVYDDLFQRVKEIAEQKKPHYLPEYIIVYSRPRDNIKSIDIDIIAFQNKDHIEIIPGPAKKILLVDIFYIQKGDTFEYYMRSIKYARSPGGAAVIGNAEIYIDPFIGTSKRSILQSHSYLNTAFYQQEQRLSYEAKQSAIRNPKIPRLSGGIKNGNINSRKRAIINHILQTLDEDKFNEKAGRSLDNVFLGFSSRAESDRFQEDYINALDEEQINMVEFIMDSVVPISTTLYTYREPTRNMVEFINNVDVTGIAFNSDGLIVYL